MRFFLAIAVSVAFFLPPAMVSAQQPLRTEGDVASAQGIHEAEVPVNSQSDSDRPGALARALGQVLAKLSGDRSVTGRPGVAAMLRNAGDYLQSYDYRQDSGTAAGGAPSHRTMLVARFDADKVEGLASALGLPVWPQPRPKPVLWLAIDDGSGPRLVGLQQSNAARAVLDKAIERGFRLGLPAGSAAEQALVGAIWRQDTAAVARASSRYAPPMQLIGKLYRAAGQTGWKGEWAFVDNGRVLSQWTSQDADPRRAMAQGADGAATALVKRYAKVPAVGQPGTYAIVVEGIDSADDYLALSAALQAHPLVKAFRPVQARGSELELSLDLSAGLPGFDRLLGSEAALVPVTTAEAGSSLKRYRIP